ncbi:rod shape-determining protein MreC [Intestinibacillus sp. Marseille-P6563]|uniref:rod shape-determining protein MreC n=1 Tax=Intestinibacillus sp. Marseille-P6563 TaxID=2364792 RepID=UPI000F062EB4|nr:rod shape-determining protein MreC [Intestinibacillus sp. Marseille-P6563]
MKNLFSFRVVAAFIVIILICLGLMVYSGATGRSNPVSDGIGVVMAPLQKGVTKVANVISQGRAYFEGYDALEEENAELKKKVSELEQKERDADIALEENDRLRSLLGIQERNRSFKLQTAEVIARSPGEWATTISLDKGSNQGIAVNDLVITEEGNMVGYVSNVAPTYCDVTTVIDTNMQAGALVTRTREAAIAEGDYTLMSEGNLRLSYLEPDSDVVIGDTVETSGRGGVFPKGIMIGTIERVVPEDNGISNYAVIKPFVNVEKITNVAIITDFEVNE